jgi:hypothetical protein
MKTHQMQQNESIYLNKSNNTVEDYIKNNSVHRADATLLENNACWKI